MQNAIFNGSPRSDGNCALAAKIVLKSLGCGEIYPIAKAQIAPCMACDYCATHSGKCVLSCDQEKSTTQSMHQDQALFYFQKLFNADLSFFISPIYHYHIPAQLKAFLDRSQVWYHTPKKMPHTQKKCALILVGARTQGNKLFEGATLTFKYALKYLGYDLVTPLCFYGLEQKDDLAKREDFQKKITEYVHTYDTLKLY